MISDNDRRQLSALAEAAELNFEQLTRLAGLDPATAFKGEDLRGVDFADSNLAGFDFSNADLTGASFRRARIAGLRTDFAILEGTQWPARVVPSSQTRRRLRKHQREAVNAMLMDLAERKRALAIMPPGSGRHAVLEAVIEETFDLSRGRALLIVSSAAEREQMLHRLRVRFPTTTIGSLKELRSSAAHDGILVLSDVGPKRNLVTQLHGTMWEKQIDAVFATSLDRLSRVHGAIPDYEAVQIIAVDVALLDLGRPDLRQQRSGIRKIFERASYEMSLGQFMEEGGLVPVRLVVPFPGQEDLIPRRSYPYGARTQQTDEQLRRLQPMVHGLLEVQQLLKQTSGLIVCADDRQSRMVEAQIVHLGGPSMQFRVAGQRWSTDEIAGRAREGFVIAAVTRQSIDAAAKVDNLAVMTDLKLEHAQEVAYRLPVREGCQAPLVLDFAGAFRGFPDVEFGLDSFGSKDWSIA